MSLTPSAISHMQTLWQKHDLPEVDFEHWSPEYARDIWELVNVFSRPDIQQAHNAAGEDARQALLRALEGCDVYDGDKSKQQWTPKR